MLDRAASSPTKVRNRDDVTVDATPYDFLHRRMLIVGGLCI